MDAETLSGRAVSPSPTLTTATGDAVPSAPDPAVLAGLRKAMGGPMPIQTKGPTEGLFPKAATGKPLADAAIKAGLIEERTESRPSGKGKKATVKVESLGWVLSEAGRRYLADADSPRPVLEAMLPVLQRIADELSRPRDRAAAVDPGRVVQDATAACVAAIETAFGRLQATIETEFAKARESVADSPAKFRAVAADALGRAEQSAASATPAGDNPAAGLAAILPVLRGVLARVSEGPPAPQSTPPAPTPAPPAEPRRAGPAVEVSRDALRQAMRAGYDELRNLLEFRNGLVELPPLFDEVNGRVPGLTVQRFHAELATLQAERRVELHVLNEVAAADRPELAIRQNDRLYYYIMWR